ncbi:MAG: hypothetical protein JSS66_07495 [Armatimonadetes bacterium]|nr:hypothetical protein [Armatimonadota bacterium]
MTDGTWANTSVYNNNNPLSCRLIVVDLRVCNTDEGEAGIDEGGDLEGYVDFIPPGVDDSVMEAPTQRGPIFPGSIEFQVNKKCVRIECQDPELNFMETRVFDDGLEITEDIARFYAKIDAINDDVSIWMKYKTGEQFGISEYDNVVLL